MSDILDDFLHFLHNSPTSWHAVRELGNRFASQDFLPLQEEEPWKLSLGGKYFVERDGSLCAFVLPKKKLTQSIILASHTDSPALKIKPQPETPKKNGIYLSTEIYGGPLLYSWLGKDLAIAGKIVYTTKEDTIEESLVHIDDAPLIIPELAIHLNREVNEKGLILNKQEHLCALATLTEDEEKQKNYLEALLRKHVYFNQLLAFDLFLIPMDLPRRLGMQGEMIASYRLDNLCSAHASARALLSAEESDNTLQMALFCDHEEIGSPSRQSPPSFLSDITKRIHLALGYKEEEILQNKKRSFCASIDVSHAFHGSYADKYDANHTALLGKGVTLKSNAGQRYANDALSLSYVMNLCDKNSLPYQLYVNRSDLSGGSTLGPLIAEHIGIRTLDIGVPLLSMHSSREVASVQDHYTMCSLLKHLLEEDPSHVL